MLRSMTLLLLEAGGTADGTVIRVAAETGLLHQHAVFKAVYTAPVARGVTRLLDAAAGGRRLFVDVTTCGWLLLVVEALY